MSKNAVKFVCALCSFGFLVNISFEASEPSIVHEFYKNGVNKKSCGYESCPAVMPGMLNVHLVPHTHNDVGWLKTVDQYYYGSKRRINPMGVQYILDSVVDELLKDPSRRFIYVEVAFFQRWWDEQTLDRRTAVISLVNEGRLEFILGGWCMNDEAATHYNAIIDQHTLGLQFLNETFGQCGRPRVAWQIDPFGHSREMASLFAQMGYDGLFNGRIDYEDKMNRLLNMSMEMVWKGSPHNLGESSDLFTGILYNNYSPPPGFCYDVFCDDDPIMDDAKLSGYNVDRKVDKFLAYVNGQSLSYKTQHIVLTMGQDFNYEYAHIWYKNLDKLIKYTNARQVNGSRVNMLYSTPSCYLYQLHRSNLTWPTKSDDFLPYAHRPHAFWTGYFTSRPTQKRFSRYGNNILQVVKQMSVLASLTDDSHEHHVDTLRQAMGVIQHHDAITGTAKQAVADDYTLRLFKGIQSGQTVISAAYNKLLPLTPSAKPVSFHYCDLLNISQCSATEGSTQFAALIYNPLARPVSQHIQLPITNNDSFIVEDAKGNSVISRVMPVPPWLNVIPERHSLTLYSLVFPVTLPALGFSTFFISKAPSENNRMSKVTNNLNTLQDENHAKDVVIQNEFIALVFDTSTAKLKYLRNLETNVTMPFTMEHGYYIGRKGNNSLPMWQASGAYVFRPLHQNITAFTPSVIRKVVKNELVQEVWQSYNLWCFNVIRLRQGSRHIEIDWTVGPIPIDDDNGKEVVVRYKMPDIDNDGVFYTDSNGREMIKRKLNYRPTWNFTNSEPVAGNYFPVNSRIYIQDKKRNMQLTVLTDRSEGGSSLCSGQIELMLHRRLLCDDALGVGEALNETGSDGEGLIVTGKHKIIVSTIASSPAIHRELALRNYMAPVMSFIPGAKRSSWTRSYRSEWSALDDSYSLPANVHLLTLELMDRRRLVRLEHIYEKGEDPQLSQPVTIDLKKLFPSALTAVEMSLAANMKKSDMHRLKWNIDSTTVGNVDENLKFIRLDSSNSNIVLKPMEIRTFLL